MATALLALADGSLFYGDSIGSTGSTTGEIVFNTAMTGYQEILTDPSYAQQIVTLTYPHIGNTGANEEDMESDRTYAAGLIIRDLPRLASNFRQSSTLDDFLKAQKTVAIAGIDTRRLTRLLRNLGAQNGCIVAPGKKITKKDEQRALETAKACASMVGADLAKQVTTKKSYTWKQTEWQLGVGFGDQQQAKYQVVAYDFGIKKNILRILASMGASITVVPASTPANEALALQPDGIFLSNGPGDPEPCTYAIEAIKKFIDTDIPIFGICLGHQLFGLACGARTFKMKFGHHGANHPILDLDSKKVMITSQNHGFAIDEDSLPNTLHITHRSLFDNTIQGIAHKHKPAFSVQGHPEASPGPRDIRPIFEHFFAQMEAHKNNIKNARTDAVQAQGHPN